LRSARLLPLDRRPAGAGLAQTSGPPTAEPQRTEECRAPRGGGSGRISASGRVVAVAVRINAYSVSRVRSQTKSHPTARRNNLEASGSAASGTGNRGNAGNRDRRLQTDNCVERQLVSALAGGHHAAAAQHA